LRSSSSSASLFLTRSRASSSTLLVLGISFLSSAKLSASRVVSCSGVSQSDSDSDYSYSQIRRCHSGHLDEATQPRDLKRCVVPDAQVRCAPHSRPTPVAPGLDDRCRRVYLPALQPVNSGAGKGAVIVVPGLAQRRRCQREDIGQVIFSEKPSRTKMVAYRVDAPAA
jgi:hypothetical protein